MDRYKTPIPVLHRNLASWKEIPIIECGEKLVSLSQLSSRYRIVVRPEYYIRSVSGAISDCLVRKRVADMLIAASQKLPDSLRVVVWDAWRPIRVQRTLFDKYLTILRQEYPDMNEKDLAARASVFVALPSDDVRCPSPHNTGGAVDVSIIKENGEYLEMGTDFDDFSPSAHTRYFENIVLNDAVSSKELVYLQNRRLLYFAMTSVGFANYPEEWWHYDYGNQFWASVLGQPVAIYGSAHLPVKQ